MPDEPYQSLYRRYRPQRFDEVRGQEHVTRALRNSVREGRVAHAYLFSGPRGTGKTSTARILAKALNCTDLQDGEPCGVCESCVQVQRGASLDVVELDAASNRKLDEMRDLLSRVALGTPGRWKVYIIDEVHQLTPDASSALLKTLEEPPAHVVFVLATTDPQKVLPTIRSRTQHFEFRLLPADILGQLVHDVNTKAGLGVMPEAIDLVVRKGAGSARDALSVLDQVAASGEVVDEGVVVDELVESLCERDAGRALVAVAEGVGAGRDPRQLTVDLLEHLRHAFLAVMARSLVPLPDDAVDHVEDQARRLGTPGLVRAMETLGEALVEMRESLDTRVSLEVALVRIARPEADASPAALLERIERLERGLSGHVTAPAVAEAHEAMAAATIRTTPAPPARPAAPTGDAPPGTPPARAAGATADAPASPPSAGPASAVAESELPAGEPASAPAPATEGAPAAAARAALGAHRRSAPAGTPARPAERSAPPAPPAASPRASSPRPPTRPQPAPAPPAAADGSPSPAGFPSRDDLTKAWGDGVLASLRPAVKARYAAGRFLSADGGVAVYGLPNQPTVQQCEPYRADVESALTAHFGVRVPVRLVAESDAGAGRDQGGGPSEPPDDDSMDPRDLDALEDAPAAVTSPEDRLKQAFPGAEEVP